MTQEPPKSNAVLIVIAIIGVLGTIIASIISVIGSYNVEKLRQETELTRIALVSIATQGGATQISMENTLSAPTNTLSPDFLNGLQPTYTPYPTYTQSIIPVISTQTKTPEPNLIFEDNFDNGINSQYWQSYGLWSVSNGVPVVVEKFNSESKYNQSAFAYMGGLVFPGTEQLDNIAIEFNIFNGNGVYFLLSVRDEYNFKRFYLTDTSVANLEFVSNGSIIYIPDSYIDFSKNSPTHVRVEIRGNSLVLYVNQKKVYDFMNLPEPVTGNIGIASQGGASGIWDNFKIYQLP